MPREDAKCDLPYEEIIKRGFEIFVQKRQERVDFIERWDVYRQRRHQMKETLVKHSKKRMVAKRVAVLIKFSQFAKHLTVVMKDLLFMKQYRRALMFISARLYMKLSIRIRKSGITL